MLQEIVVPVVTVQAPEGQEGAREDQDQAGDVQVLGDPHKITTPKHRFKLIQMEPVSDRTKPITLKVAVYEADEPGDQHRDPDLRQHAPSSIDERQKSVILTLQDRQYDKTHDATAWCCGMPTPASSSRAST